MIRKRHTVIEIETKGGRTLAQHTKSPPGTVQNPMTKEQLTAKARDLMTPGLGPARTEKLIAKLQDSDAVRNVRELRPFLSA